MIGASEPAAFAWCATSWRSTACARSTSCCRSSCIPFLARVLGADGWGLVAGAQALAIYGIVTVEYGFELAGTRAVARDRERRRRGSPS